ncbi:thrombospondin type 3 repeat-containing protein [Thermus sp. PS18]|uniref:hypothetical protein n=1 Tax=Thermus sp. PS18 TaxID=2849039 RepID=UPI002263D18F|nr:hypothetical protein [Thermus sp. PS18]UZX16522.1 thrombospondin type 3 repeat-containing protein [Thermus sp. PS18]
MTLDEIIQWSNAQYARQATIGRYVRWGGSIVLGAALVAAGLDYYYNLLKRETGTSLDQWYHWVSAVGAGLGSYSVWVEGPSCRKAGGCYQWELSYRCGYGYRWAAYAFAFPGGVVGDSDGWYGPWVQGSAPQCDALEEVRRKAQDHFRAKLWSPYSGWRYEPVRPEHVGGVPEGARSRFQSDLSWLVDVLVDPGEKPSLPEWLQAHPDAANGVKQAVQTYIDSMPIGSPSQPWPGIQLLPVPNPNQWTDNPFTRPDIDTDGDGYPDAVEWEEANRRGVPWPDLINNPDAYPDPKADPDGDGYPTGEEIAVGTNPYDANSRPGGQRTPWVDTDGDGYPDHQEISAGTDPNNPNSFPSDQAPEPKPEDEGWPGGPPAPGLKPVEFPERQAERKPLPEVKPEVLQSWEEQVVRRWQEEMNRLKGQVSDKFPFGIIVLLRDVRPSAGGPAVGCTFTVPLGVVQSQIDVCNNPIFQTMEDFRPIWAALLWLTAGLLMVRRALDIQGGE